MIGFNLGDWRIDNAVLLESSLMKRLENHLPGNEITKLSSPDSYRLFLTRTTELVKNYNDYLNLESQSLWQLYQSAQKLGIPIQLITEQEIYDIELAELTLKMNTEFELLFQKHVQNWHSKTTQFGSNLIPLLQISALYNVNLSETTLEILMSENSVADITWMIQKINENSQLKSLYKKQLQQPSSDNFKKWNEEIGDLLIFRNAWMKKLINYFYDMTMIKLRIILNQRIKLQHESQKITKIHKHNIAQIRNWVIANAIMQKILNIKK